MKVVLYSLIILLSSCALFKSSKKNNVEGFIQIHKPYCGGAKPTPEMSKGTFEPYANATFYLKSSMNNSKREQTVAIIRTDEKGKFRSKIPVGNYLLIHSDKVLSFNEFLKKHNKPQTNLEYIGEEEAKKNYLRADHEVQVTEAGIQTITYQSKCFTGLNPCLKYTGPKPQ